MTDEAILSRYETLSPDEPIDLYEGGVTASWGGHTYIGSGSIRFEWQPFPRIAFDILLDVPFEVPDSLEELELDLVDRAGRARAQPWQSLRDFDLGVNQRRVIGDISDDLVVGSPAPTGSIVFHLPNFPPYLGRRIQSKGQDGNKVWAGRLSASNSEWSVDIDSVPHLDALAKSMLTRTSHGITHVGCVTRLDGKPVQYAQVAGIRDTLNWWLSLLRSERTGPILVMGIHEGEATWEIWRTPSVAPWRGRRSWLPRIDPVDADPTLERVHAISKNDELRRAITYAIDWYTQSVENTHLATTVILAQAGLELMSWLQLVQVVGLSEEVFDKMTAADALRITLAFARIPSEVPNNAVKVLAAAQPSGGLPLLDGPSALVGIRNGSIHPKARQRLMGSDVMLEGGFLAIRFLELLLLRYLGYTGLLFDRIDWHGTEKVPWS
jgi:hypothetical protein